MESLLTGSAAAALTDLLDGPDGPLPLLMLDLRPGMTARGGPAEEVTALLGQGFRAAILGQPPAAAAGWRLELAADRAARLTAPGGLVFWDGECGQPRPWRELITRTGRCAVLIGAIGLYPAGERPAARIETRLEQAARAGDLAAGLVVAACAR